MDTKSGSNGPTKDNALDTEISKKQQTPPIAPEKIEGRIAKTKNNLKIPEVPSVLEKNASKVADIATKVLDVKTPGTPASTTIMPKVFRRTAIAESAKTLKAYQTKIRATRGSVTQYTNSMSGDMASLEKLLGASLTVNTISTDNSSAQVKALLSIDSFNQNITKTYYTKQLALSYQTVFSLKDLLSTMVTVGQTLESKLEAIKMNTAAPEVSKRSIIDVAKEHLVRTAVGGLTDYAKDKVKEFVEPSFNNLVKRPATAAFNKWKTGDSKSAAKFNDLNARLEAFKKRAAAGELQYEDIPGFSRFSKLRPSLPKGIFPKKKDTGSQYDKYKEAMNSVFKPRGNAPTPKKRPSVAESTKNIRNQLSTIVANLGAVSKDTDSWDTAIYAWTQEKEGARGQLFRVETDLGKPVIKPINDPSSYGNILSKIKQLISAPSVKKIPVDNLGLLHISKTHYVVTMARTDVEGATLSLYGMVPTNKSINIIKLLIEITQKFGEGFDPMSEEAAQLGSAFKPTVSGDALAASTNKLGASISKKMDRFTKSFKFGDKAPSVTEPKATEESSSSSFTESFKTVGIMNAMSITGRLKDALDSVLATYMHKRSDLPVEENTRESPTATDTQEPTEVVGELKSIKDLLGEWRAEQSDNWQKALTLLATASVTGVASASPDVQKLVSKKEVIKDLLKAPFRLGWKGAKLAGKAYWGMAKFTAMAPIKITKALFKAREKDPYIDLYVKGDPSGKPIVTAKQLRKGLVFADTGERVESVEDIDRPVLDPETNEIVISEDDIKAGLIDRRGKSGTRRRAGTIIGSVLGGIGSITGGVGKGIAGLGKGFFSPKNPLWGIYGTMLKGGIGAAAGVGKFGGNALLSLLNPKNLGLIGRGVGSVFNPLMGMYSGMFNLGLKGIAGAGSFGMSMIKRMLGIDKGGNGSASKEDLEQIIGNRLDDIYDLLKGYITSKTASAFGDTDGDGTREGSYQDYIKSIEEKRQSRRDKMEAESGKWSSRGGLLGLLGSGGSALKNLFSKKDKEEEDGDDSSFVEDTASTAAAGLLPAAWRKIKGGAKASWNFIKKSKNIKRLAAAGLGAGALYSAMGPSSANASELPAGTPGEVPSVLPENQPKPEGSPAGSMLGAGAIGAGTLAAGSLMSRFGGEKAAEKTMITSAAKLGEKSVGKFALKQAVKVGAKKVPGVAIFAGSLFALQRMAEGDYLGAAGEMASGIAGMVPLYGTAVSVAIDAWLGYRDWTKPTPYMRLIKARMDAYGVENPERYDAVLELEEEATKVLSGKRKRFETADFLKYGKVFGFDLTVPTANDDPKSEAFQAYNYFVIWFREKFTRIFGMYVTALKKYEYDPVNVQSIDDEADVTSIITEFEGTVKKFADKYQKFKPSVTAFRDYYKETTAPNTVDTTKFDINKPEAYTGNLDDLSPQARAAVEEARSDYNYNTYKPIMGLTDEIGNMYQDSLQWSKQKVNTVARSVGIDAPFKDADGGTGPAPGSEGLGSLSAKFESNKKGSNAIGYDSTGGTSYGKYQISSSTMPKFINWLKSQGGEAADLAAQLSQGGPINTGSTQGALPDLWRKLASEGKLKNYEHDFIKMSHYDAAFNKLSGAQRDLISKSATLQDVLWSTAVQHGDGGAASIFNSTFNPEASPEDWVNKIYDVRGTKFGSSTPAVRQSVLNRFVEERKIALSGVSTEKTQLAKDTTGSANATPTDMATADTSVMPGGSGGTTTSTVGSIPPTNPTASPLPAKQTEGSSADPLLPASLPTSSPNLTPIPTIVPPTTSTPTPNTYTPQSTPITTASNTTIKSEDLHNAIASALQPYLQQNAEILSSAKSIPKTAENAPQNNTTVIPMQTPAPQQNAGQNLGINLTKTARFS